LPSLFEARRRLPTSATALTTCGQPNPSSSILAGTEASTSFLFLRATPLSIAGSGDARRAALRPVVRAPVSVSPTLVSLPDRDTHSTASPPRLSPQSIVRIYAHGSKDRAKDASPERMRRSLVPALVAYALCAHADVVPLLGDLRTSAVVGASACGGGYRCLQIRADRGPRSSDAPRREPLSRRPGCLSPPRHAKDSLSRRDCSLRPSRRLSCSRRPHFFPRLGTVLLIGHCKVTVRSPAGP